MLPEPVCTGCYRSPDEIPEYRYIAEAEGYENATEAVRHEEGTYNPANGHFLCDACYIKAGMPSSPTGWVAP